MPTGTPEKGAWLAIVVDREARVVLGHHLLDLDEEYGFPDQPVFLLPDRRP